MYSTSIARVAEDKTVKVADFGLSRDLFDNDYYRMEDLNKPLPIKWMAIESLNDSVFTRESDVVSSVPLFLSLQPAICRQSH